MNARIATLFILVQFEKEKDQLKQIRDQFIKSKNLSALDRQRTVALTNEIIRWRPVLDFLFSPYLKYPKQRLNPKVLNALRLGTYEGLFDKKIPPFAAIHSAVDTIKVMSNKKASGLVNAVLRKTISKHKDSFHKEKNYENAFPIWLYKKWRQEYGAEKTKRLANEFLKNRPIFIRIDDRINHVLTEIRQADIQTKKFADLDHVYEIVKGGGKLTNLGSFKNGYFSIQDPGATAIIHLVNPKPNEVILDVCGAPGTKAFGIAHKMEQMGQLYVSDYDPKRLHQVKEDAERFGFKHITVEQKDATHDLYPMADKILIDIPCSGTGVIGRKPDLKWRRKKQDIEEFPKTQKKILSHMSQFVKKGGSLIYATCSLEREENWEIVDDFLKLNPDFEIEPAQNWVPNSWVDQKNCMLSFPGTHNTDGIYGCRMKRK